MPRLTPRKKAPCGRSPRPSQSAERAGVKVSELKAERATEKAMVSENCL